MREIELGAFSVSLAVRDLDASCAFYERLGFTRTGGGRGYVMLRHGTTVLGLFQGMFEENILTFNPGLRVAEGETVNPLEDWRTHDFMDVRTIQRQLKERGVELLNGVDERKNPDGPGSLMLVDPDGNAILIDQFFPSPRSASQDDGDYCE